MISYQPLLTTAEIVALSAVECAGFPDIDQVYARHIQFGKQRESESLCFLIGNAVHLATQDVEHMIGSTALWASEAVTAIAFAGAAALARVRSTFDRLPP
jgi:hypothetical protein